MPQIRTATVLLRSALAPLPLAALVFAAPAAHAFDYTWNGRVGSGWRQGQQGQAGARTNWVGEVIPLSASTTSLLFTGTTGLTNTNNIASPFVLNRLAFSTSAGAFNISGGDLSFVSNGATTPTLQMDSAADITLGMNLRLTNDLTLNGAGTGVLTLDGLLSVNSSTVTNVNLIKNSTGELRISGGTGATTSIISSSILLNNGATTLTGRLISNSTSVGSSVGSSGTANLTIQNGGVLTLKQLPDREAVASIGNAPGTSAMATVTGAGSLWNDINRLSVGNGGTGTLTIQDGGLVVSENSDLGAASGSSGTVTVTGADSRLDGGLLTVGRLGTGNLVIENGGFVTSTGASIGNAPGTSGTVTITGAGSQWDGSSFSVGNGGTGTLTIQNGGVVNGLSAFLGSSNNGTVTVTGAGSRWNLDGTLFAGYSSSGTLTGTGILTIQNGGVVTNQTGYVGYALGTSGTVTVAGAGSQWNTLSNLTIGRLGTGTLTIQNGGLVTVGGLTSVNAASSLIIDGGTLQTGSLSLAAGGTATLTNYNAATPALIIGGTSTSSTLAARLTNGANGAGSLTKTGRGTLTLTGNNTYTGTGQVQGGTLIQSGGTNQGSYTVLSGATLRFQSGAVVTPGGGFGELRANAGGNVQYDNATVNGGFLRGPGTHTIQSGGATFNGTTTSASTNLVQNGAATLNNFQNGGTLISNATLTAGNLVNTSSGKITVNAVLNAEEFVSDGILNVATTGTLNNGSASSLVLGGGSRTSIGSASAPRTGGTLNLGGQTLEVNGGLLVNNGTITNGLVNVNYGALAKGAGIYAGGYALNDGGRIIFGNSPGILSSGSATWNAGSLFNFQLANATGGAGVGWGFNDITGTLNLNGGLTPASQITLLLETLDSGSNASGFASNFDATQSYDWVVASASGGILGFNPNAFVLDTTSFRNLTNGGTFGVYQSGNTLGIHFTSASGGTAATAPEPGSIAFLLIAGVPAVSIARRRKPRV